MRVRMSASCSGVKAMHLSLAGRMPEHGARPSTAQPTAMLFADGSPWMRTDSDTLDMYLRTTTKEV